MKILGITGTLGAGKGTVVDYLVHEKGFKHYSVRVFLTREIQQRELDVNRDNMVMVANDLRAANSPAYIVEQLYEQALNLGVDCVIESIRSPGEVEALASKGNFFLLAVDADPKLRYERIKSRSSDTDHISYETFLQNEEREMNSSDPNKQNLQRCREMANFTLDNDGSIEDLHKKTEEILNEIN